MCVCMGGGGVLGMGLYFVLYELCLWLYLFINYLLFILFISRLIFLIVSSGPLVSADEGGGWGGV